MKTFLIRSIAALTTLATASIPSSFITAAELRDTTKVATKTKVVTSGRDQLSLTSDVRLMIDPQTGELLQTTRGEISVTGTSSDDDPSETQQTAPEAPAELPYDFFNPTDDGTSTLNAYFLSQLSMGVYGTALNEADFKQDLIDTFESQGIPGDNIDVFMDPVLGTELAVFTIGEATVFSFRGTSGEGTVVPDMDQEIDLMDKPILVKVNNKECRIHEGFWISSDIAFNWVLERAMEAHLAGQRIFLTGHSLGGAKATVTAFRLFYDHQIPLQGLQTFGSPKVGDITFRTQFSDPGPDGIKLAEITERFVVIGDPATTFPNKEYISLNPFKQMVVYYEHVGNVHNMFSIDGDQEFEIGFDSGEVFFIPLPSQWVAFLSGVGEHMWYDDALLYEVLDDSAYTEIAELIEDHESVVQPPPN